MEDTIQTAFDYIQIRQSADLSCLLKVSAHPTANAVVTRSYAKATYVETSRKEFLAHIYWQIYTFLTSGFDD